MSDKKYAIKIENVEHGLLFHFTFTEEEAKSTKLHIGIINDVLDHGFGFTEQHINSKSISIQGLHDWVFKNDSD